MRIELVVAGAQFAFVFAKAFQQRNVAFDHYRLIIPTSFLMAIIEAFVIATIAINGFTWGIVSAMAIGGSVGCILAMYIHRRYF